MTKWETEDTIVNTLTGNMALVYQIMARATMVINLEENCQYLHPLYAILEMDYPKWRKDIDFSTKELEKVKGEKWHLEDIQMNSAIVIVHDITNR